MNKEKKKKLLRFLKSDIFCKGFLVLCSLIGIAISLGQELSPFILLSFPVGFFIGGTGLIFIPMICDKKLADLEDSSKDDIIKEEKNVVKDINLEMTKKIKPSKELINIIDNILLANPCIGVKIELLPEWQEYLENTFIDENGIKLVQELIYYLMLLNTLPIERIIPLLKEREAILDLLIYFSDNGEYLAKALNRKIKDIKRERTI